MVKFVIVSTHGNDNFERASMAWAVANAAHVLDAEVTVFLQAEGVNVVRKDFAKGWVFPPFTALETLIKNFMEMGGKVFACVPCVEARNIKKRLIAEISGIEGVKSVERIGNRMVVECGKDLRSEISEAVIKDKASLLELRVRATSLEDVYKRYLGA